MNLRWLPPGRFTRKFNGAYIETNRSERNAIIVAGSARSGTTWVGDVARKHHSRIGEVLQGNVKYGCVEKQRRPGIFRRRVIKTIRANMFLGYDDLARNRTGWRRALEHLGLSSIADRSLDRLTSRRSFTSHPSAQKNHATRNGGSSRLSGSDRERILSLVDAYGLLEILRETIPAWS